MVNDFSDLGFVPEKNTGIQTSQSNQTDFSDVGFVPLPKDQQPESGWKTASRWITQPLKGLAYYFGKGYGAAAEWNRFTAMEPPDIEEEAMMARMNPNFNREKFEKEYEQGQAGAMKYNPSISGIANFAEAAGIPTEAKTPGQKRLETFSLGAGGGGGLVSGAAAKTGVIASTLYEGYKAMGIPDDHAQTLALGFAGGANFLSGEGKVAGISKAKPIPPSGVPPGGGAPPSAPPGGGAPPSAPPPGHPGAIIEEPSRAEYDIGEETLNLLKKTKAVEKAENAQARISPKPLPLKPTGTQEKTLKEALILPSEGHQVLKRVATKEIEKGIREAEAKPTEPLTQSEEIGETISKYTEPNKTKVGKQLIDTIFNKSEANYKKVNETYFKSRELNKNNYIDTANFYKNLDELVNEAKTLPEYREDAQLVKMADDIKNRLIKDSTTDIHGNIRPLSFKELSSQELIDLATDLRKYVEQAYSHSPKNVFYKIIDATENAILQGARKDPKAYKSYMDAKLKYKEWAETYNNDTVRKYRNPESTNYEQMYGMALNPDTFNIISPILEKESGTRQPSLVAHIIPENVQKGIDLASIVKRDIVQKELEPFLIKNGKFNPEIGYSRKFVEKIDSMSSILNQKEKQSIINLTRKLGKKYQTVAGKKVKIHEPTIKEYFWEGKIPEDMAGEIDTVSGLKKTNSRLKDFPEQYAQFEKIKHEMAVRRLTSGKIEGDERTIINVLNNPDNLRYMEECIGKETVKDWKQKASNIKKYEKELEKYKEEMKALEKKELRDKTESERQATLKAKEEIKEKERISKRNEIIAHILVSPLPGPSSLKHFIVSNTFR